MRFKKSVLTLSLAAAGLVAMTGSAALASTGGRNFGPAENGVSCSGNDSGGWSISFSSNGSQTQTCGTANLPGSSTIPGFGTVPGFDTWLGEPSSVTPAKPQDTTAPAPAAGNADAAMGQTMNRNWGYDGTCEWYVLDRFYKQAGVYPQVSGNADNFANSAGQSGWTVSDAPRVGSIAVFQPGMNGAGDVGHVAWVESISGNQITISEMNFPNPDQVTTRTIDPDNGVQYVYVP